VQKNAKLLEYKSIGKRVPGCGKPLVLRHFGWLVAGGDDKVPTARSPTGW